MFYLQRIEPLANRRRWFSIHLQARLFGGVDLVCRSGRLGARGGTEVREPFATEGDARRRAEELLESRRRHGYVLCYAAWTEPPAPAGEVVEEEPAQPTIDAPTHH